MDYARNEERARAFSDKDVGLDLASATSPAPESGANIQTEMAEDAPSADTATRRTDPSGSDAEQDVSHHGDNLSPNSQSQGHLHHQQVTGSGDGEMFRSDDPDLRQFYPVPGPALTGPRLGQDFHYDDLPLVFSMPGSEDDNSKVFSCHICSFKTAFKNSLVNHQAVHSDMRPWICDICDYAAKRKQDLKKHLQTMHGMVVDSLALRPGINPPLSSVSSSGLASPVETKPVIINNVAVSSDQCGISPASYAGSSYSRSSAAVFPPQPRGSGCGLQLPSTAKLNPLSRSVAVPDVGKFIGDKFPFNQFYGEGGGTTTSKAAAHSFAEMLLNRMHSTLRDEPDSDHAEREATGVGNLFYENYTPKQEGKRQSCSQRDLALTDTKYDGQALSVSETLPVDRKRYRSVSDQLSTATTESAHVGLAYSKDFTVTDIPVGKVSSHSEQTESTYGRKRTSVDSPSDKMPAKTAKFQSPVSDSDRSSQVTSQSDHSATGGGDVISSTVSHPRSLETRKSFHCAHCDILYFENALYLMHMGLHDNSNPWKCSICGQTFFEKYSFTSHFINQH